MIFVILALLILCSGGVSASETALFALTRQTLSEFRNERAHLRRRVFRLMQRPHRVLMTVLITNTAVNVAVFTVSFMAFTHHRDARPWFAALGAVATLVALILFGEIVPKTIAMAAPRRLAPPAGALILALELVLRPLQWFLAAVLVNPAIRLLSPARARAGVVTTDELRRLVEHSAREGAINSTENGMLQAVVALGDISVREVMTPRVDLVAMNVQSHARDILAKAKRAGRRKLLVFGRDLDDIRGAITVRDLRLQPSAAVADLVRPTVFVPEQINLVQLLRNFQASAVTAAVVVDEYGGTAGFVSTSDVVERIVGDLPTEDRHPATVEIEQIDGNTYRLPGDLGVHLWAERFGIQEVDPHVDTVAGLILSKLGRLPHVGESVHVSNLTMTVERMTDHRIESVRLRHGVAPTDEDGANG